MDPQKATPGQESDNDNVDTSPTPPDAARDASTNPLTDQPIGDAAESLFTPKAGETFKPEHAASTGDQQGSVPPVESAAPATTPTVPEADSPAPDTAPPAPATELFAKDEPVNPLPVATPGHGKKGLLVGILVAVLVLLGGGAAAAYYYTVNTPENVLKQALANALDTEKAKTVQFSGVVSVDDVESDTDIEASFQGTADNKTGAFDISSSLDVLVASLTFDARSADGKTYYIKVGGLEGLSQLLSGSSDSALTTMDAMVIGTYAPLLDSINDQWLEINQSLIEQATGSSIKELSDADRKKIVDAYQQHTFIVIKEKLANESIKGTDSYHYKVGLDKTALKAFVAAVKSAKIDALKVTADQLKEFNSAIDGADLDQSVDVWIAKSDKTIRQVAMKFAAEGDTMTMRLTVDSYNKPVKVEKPSDAKSIMELISDFMTGGYTNDFTLDSDGQLQSGISL